MKFYEALNAWFVESHRALPFRETREPYKIWISEVMLQQTQVVTVIDYYRRFIKRFPTVEALAMAEEDDVFKAWEGLGYYSRARHLMRAAKVIVNDYNGVFPSDLESVLKLPGVGPYTAGAVLSIAFNQKVPAVDGNVMRVMARVFEIEDDISQPKSRGRFEAEVMKTMGGEPYIFNQAIMELGALICTPKQPKCAVCPVQSFCKGFQHQTMLGFPVKLKKLQKQHLKIAMVIATYNDQHFLIKRPSEGLMANLWAFPTCDTTAVSPMDENRKITAFMEEEYGFKVLVSQHLKGKKHVFTHLVWDVTLYFAVLSEAPMQVDYPMNTWLGLEQLETLPFPTAYKKQFELIEELVGKSHV